jgi:hypothetical protein
MSTSALDNSEAPQPDHYPRQTHAHKLAAGGGGSAIILLLQSLPANSNFRIFITPLVPVLPIYYPELVMIIKALWRKRQLTKSKQQLDEMVNEALQDETTNTEFKEKIRQLRAESTYKKIQSKIKEIDMLEAPDTKPPIPEETLRKAMEAQPPAKTPPKPRRPKTA